MMEEMTSAIKDAASPAVQMWLYWMSMVFLASFAFVRKYKSARIVCASIALTLYLGWLIYDQTKSPHLIGLAHILVWGPLTFYLIKYELKSKMFNVRSAYGTWLVLLLTTMIISLVFDIRDAVLVFKGMK